jgi:hypothetical protein
MRLAPWVGYMAIHIRRRAFYDAANGQDEANPSNNHCFFPGDGREPHDVWMRAVGRLIFVTVAACSTAWNRLYSLASAATSSCRLAALGDGMTRSTASVVAILLATLPGVVSAQVNCDPIPPGPTRTDCYLGLSQFYRAQSDLAAARARVQSDAAWYLAITGTAPPKHRPHRRR